MSDLEFFARLFAMNDDETWPRPPIWREDLDKIRELMTPDEFDKLMRSLVHIEHDGPLHDFRVVSPKPSKN